VFVFINLSRNESKNNLYVTKFGLRYRDFFSRSIILLTLDKCYKFCVEIERFFSKSIILFTLNRRNSIRSPPT
jgi:hypothetical protein